MEIILLEKIRNLGELGDKVKVKAGYGRNFLIPTGKAVSATGENLKKFEERKAELENAAQKNLQIAQDRQKKLAGMKIRVASKAGAEGKLFGSVGTVDIAEAISNISGTEVKRREVLMPAGPFRQVGEYDVELLLHTDVTTTIKVIVEPE